MITSLSSVPAKRFLHYYFYVLDPIMRPMSLCVASYLPFSVNCFMNGHSYVAGELRRPGVAFRMEDNAIIRCADPDLLITIAERLDERILQQRANFWASRLAPRFSARERANCQLHYQWSVAQVEFMTGSGAPCESVTFSAASPSAMSRSSFSALSTRATM